LLLAVTVASGEASGAATRVPLQKDT
jgi:hypothetical protein